MLHIQGIIEIHQHQEVLQHQQDQHIVILIQDILKVIADPIHHHKTVQQQEAEIQAAITDRQVHLQVQLIPDLLHLRAVLQQHIQDRSPVQQDQLTAHPQSQVVAEVVQAIQDRVVLPQVQEEVHPAIQDQAVLHVPAVEVTDHRLPAAEALVVQADQVVQVVHALVQVQAQEEDRFKHILSTS